MQKFILCIAVLCQISVSTYAQNPKSHQIYTANGSKTTFKKMMNQLEKADLIFFGEQHNNPIAHWLQLEAIKYLQEKRTLILGAEMFESDNQEILNDFLSSVIDEKKFKESARLWNNYETDYKPLVDFAKKHQIQFVATNIPRKYASLIFKKGFSSLDSLSNTEKSWIAPLPIQFEADLSSYAEIKKMVNHGGNFMAESQASKDATMAHFILNNFMSGSLFIHFNGSFHSKNHEGIVWYVRQKKPSIKLITITTVEQENIRTLEHSFKNIADFIIAIPENMTKTY